MKFGDVTAEVVVLREGRILILICVDLHGFSVSEDTLLAFTFWAAFDRINLQFTYSD